MPTQMSSAKAGSPVIYRVWFEGADLAPQAIDQLHAHGVVYESTHRDRAGHCRHSARTHAVGDMQAVRKVAEATADHGEFTNHQATVVTDADGRPLTGALDRAWSDIDWTIPVRGVLTSLERTVLGALLDDHEPVWTILQDPDVAADGSAVEAALSRLEGKGLVSHRTARGWEPGRELAIVSWWAITQKGWDILGLIKSPYY